MIERYRGVTAAIGYQGDTILNSLGDIMCFGLGFMLRGVSDCAVRSWFSR
jgi:hypothetical protein